jgi:hypothetical protein
MKKASTLIFGLFCLLFFCNLTTAQTNCTYSLTPSSVNLTPWGEASSFTINTQPGCNWTAMSNASWISVSNASGSGTGTVNFAVQANGGQARTGTISAGWETFTVNQFTACPFSLTQSSASLSAAGGGGSFQVSTTADCSWDATTRADWITITSGAATGNGTVLFTVQPNTDAARTGIIIAGGQIFTVYQEGVVNQPTLINITAYVIDSTGRDVRNALFSFTNNVTGETRFTQSNHFGIVHFSKVQFGQPYTITIRHKRYTFPIINTKFDGQSVSIGFVADP